MIAVTTCIAIALATLVGGGVSGFFIRGAAAPSEVEAALAPDLAEAQTGLAVAQWPALQVATAAALQPDPPPCAMEYAAYLASIQGGTDGQAMSATDARGMAEALQACMGGAR